MIMILTGKCNEDFVNFRLDKFSHVEFIDLPILLQNALIIEWFDSVGIYIDVRKTIGKYWIYYIWSDNKSDKTNISALDPMQETRQEATEKAIIKANEIYNETKA